MFGARDARVARRQKVIMQVAPKIQALTRSILLMTLAIVVVSLLGRAPSPQMQARHEQVHLTLDENGY